MYNSFAMACQPYCLMQMPHYSYQQYLLQPGSKFLLPQFLPFVLPQNEGQVLPIGLKSEENTSAALAEPNEAKEPSRARSLQKLTQGRHVIKEKIIKKPANRPATYLTERRFYLAQAIEGEASAGRRLRPRIFKKRSMKALESSPCSKSEENAELQRANSVDKEAGSSQLHAIQTQKGNSCAEQIVEQGSILGSRPATSPNEGSVECSEP